MLVRTKYNVLFVRQPQVSHKILRRSRPIDAKRGLATEIPPVQVKVCNPERVIGMHMSKKKVAGIAEVTVPQVPQAMSAAAATIEEQLRVAGLHQDAGSELSRIGNRRTGTQERDRDGRVCCRFLGYRPNLERNSQ